MGQADKNELLGDTTQSQLDASFHGDNYLVGDGNNIFIVNHGNDVLDGGDDNDR